MTCPIKEENIKLFDDNLKEINSIYEDMIVNKNTIKNNI